MVKELIEFLQTCPPDTRVMVRSYELGVTDLEPEHCAMTYAKLDEWKGMEPNCGPHEQQDDAEDHLCFEGDTPGTVVPIVLLERG